VQAGGREQACGGAVIEVDIPVAIPLQPLGDERQVAAVRGEGGGLLRGEGVQARQRQESLRFAIITGSNRKGALGSPSQPRIASGPTWIVTRLKNSLRRKLYPFKW
jgi:hypothetical protein